MGEKLRAARRKANWTLMRVARESGYSKQHLSQVELGKRPPPPPQHRLYEVVAAMSGLDVATLRRLARREREHMVLGVPWHKRTA
jgi:transcriptional regulator with XRE-family HTH domain